LENNWALDPRWSGIRRPYTAQDVDRLRGTVHVEHTLAAMGAKRLWKLLLDEPFVPALGALTGNQAIQQVQAGLKAIYLSGWQVAADAEAGFGGPLNAFELMKDMIEAGAAAVHFEDQLASAKKCGHMGGKVVIPTQMFVQKLFAARLAADVMGVSTVLIARTDANSARLLTSGIDAQDEPFLTGESTADGFLGFTGGIESAIA